MIPLGRLKVPRGADTEAAVQEIVRHINRLQELLDAEYSTTQRKNDKAVRAVSDRAEEISGEVEEVQGEIDNLSNVYVQKEEGKGLSSNDYTDSEKTKLSGIESGAQKNVKSDWTEDDSSDDAYIKNKPALKAVATSGSYEDLTNKPTIPGGSITNPSMDGTASPGTSDYFSRGDHVHPHDTSKADLVLLSDYLLISDITAVTSAEIETIINS